MKRYPASFYLQEALCWLYPLLIKLETYAIPQTSGTLSRFSIIEVAATGPELCRASHHGSPHVEYRVDEIQDSLT